LLIQIGTTKFYSEDTLAAVLGSDDSIPLSESMPESLTLAEVFSVLAIGTVKRGSLAIHHTIEEASTAEFVVKDALGATRGTPWHFTKGMQVLIQEDDETMIFGGVVDSVEEEPLTGLSPLIWHNISCVDWHYLAGKRLVVYAATDTATDVAVDYILATYLADEGITEGYIEPGPVLAEIALNYVSASAAMDALAEKSNFTWFIDENKALYFCSRTTYAADWSLTNADIEHGGLRLQNGNPKYRNRQYVMGAYAETALQTEQFLGDATQTSFTAGYPINRISTLTVNGAAQSVGLKGLDTGYQWYYASGSETFTQDSAGSKVPAGQVIEIAYYGLFKKLAMQEDDTEILANQAREGVGTGIVESILTDESLSSGDAADEYANAMLTEYAVAGKKISYKTRRAGLAAGVRQACLGEGDFLITNLDITESNDIIYYSIQGVQGPVEESWEKFFLFAFSNADKIRENLGDGEAVRALTVFIKNWTEAERPNIWTEAPIGAGLAVSSDLWPCFAEDERVRYLILISAGGEGFRKAITSINDAVPGVIGTTTFISGPEANGVQWTHVAWVGGNSASLTPGSGVEIDRQDYSKLKSALEALQLDHRDYIWA
jgi:hypothetical protein